MNDKQSYNFLDVQYRHIFVDFDSTLYLWDHIREREEFPGDLEWKAKCLKPGGRSYRKDNLNSLLLEYLSTQVGMLHLLTHVEFSFEAQNKFDFVNSVCPGLLTDWIGVSSPESKVKLLQIFELLGNLKESMLIIDDNHDVVTMCRNAGFDVAEPQWIMDMISSSEM